MTKELRISHPRRAGGFSLIEVLITIVILSFGLLGIASMLLNGMTLNNASYLRSVATQQAYDMGDRIRANGAGVIAGNYNAITYPPASSCTNCTSASCSAANLAASDACNWNKQNAALLPMGQGAVTRNGTDFIITVSWDNNKDGVVDANDYFVDSDGNGSNDASYSVRVQP
ncbi:MAG: type IV pilus modification protein PilV [Dechloromonas sp.]|nr:MAG: type IV pilus modification protein PilV [Dechloromonas sp.]